MQNLYNLVCPWSVHSEVAPVAFVTIAPLQHSGVSTVCAGNITVSVGEIIANFDGYFILVATFL